MKTAERTKRLKRFSKRLIKGKVFRKSEFGTGLLDRTPRGIISQWHKTRPPGERPAPAKLVLPAQNASTETGGDIVRIYVGSEPEQHRAERVLLWSILKHRDPSRRYEIYIMKDLRGFNRESWKTGFTAYRYAIPALAGFSGRAIYNDVDQIYLSDPADLLDEEMHDAGVLAVESRDTSVMLLDCDKLEGVWTLETVTQSSQGGIHTQMLKLVRKDGLIADLPGKWNARDHEYDKASSCLLHYTILHSQPWRPFPGKLRYRDNPQASPWFELEQQADSEGFAPLWRNEVARPYLDMSDYFLVSDNA